MLKWKKIEVSSGFLFVLAFAFYCDTQDLLPWALLAGAAHEVGHYFAVRALGGGLLRFRLTAVGGQMTLDAARPLSYGGELVAVLAGPTASFVFAALCAQFGLFVPAGLSLALGLFNLLPIAPLDGGRALLLGGTLLFGEAGAARVVAVSSGVFVALLLALGAAVAVESGGKWTLFAMALWLAGGFSAKMRGKLRKKCK